MIDKRRADHIHKTCLLGTSLVFITGCIVFYHAIFKTSPSSDLEYYKSFSLGLGAITVSFVFFSITKKSHKERSLYLLNKKNWPSSPWQWKKNWQKGEVLSSRRNSLVFRVLLLCLLFILAPYLITLRTLNFSLILQEIQSIEFSFSLIFGYSLMFIAFVYVWLSHFNPVLKDLYQDLKFGRSTAKFSNPIKVGQQNCFEVGVPKKLAGKEFKGILRCQDIQLKRSSRSYYESTSVLWEEEDLSIAKDSSNESLCRFKFNIVKNLPSSTYAGTGVIWELFLESPQYSTTFLIPVLGDVQLES